MTYRQLVALVINFTTAPTQLFDEKAVNAALPNVRMDDDILENLETADLALDVVCLEQVCHDLGVMDKSVIEQCCQRWTH